MNKIIIQIKKELRKKANPAKAKAWKIFFKEKILDYGIEARITDEIAKKYYTKINHLTKQEIFALCEELLKSGYNQEIKIALNWTYRLKKQFTKSDFYIFENWLKKYITNWGSDDDFCTHALGFFIFQFPKFLPQITSWTKSPNKWLRRAAAVSLIYALRRGQYLKNAFQVSTLLLRDPEDLVQKGYGWTLKEASKLYSKSVFNFVAKHKKIMNRAALRYAIENLTTTLKTKAMVK